ncbi:hypothetical protein GWE18_07565 [Bradyrhizobium sp. CSA112]|uniref:hypothetical protein n=1 Tax=Bradyrhizobium sp. CSA112 TaxID=2699170 RepID=UPI0023B1F776|nr:hypothetical protein [Bradyrhizobium sp. CSA112]MDE5452730.1 hypothetical protein [Bradyrhizobium sp. CSA112]
MGINDDRYLFALREQMHDVLSAKLKAKKDRARTSVETTQSAVKTNRDGEAWPARVTFGHFGLAWTLLPLVSIL